jgi:hypothetical protein
VEDPVDEARGPEWQDRKLEQPDQKAVGHAERKHLERQEQERAAEAVLRVQMRVHPVFLDAHAVGLDQVSVAGGLTV